jgi:SHS2 domain-containing protein
LHPDLGVAPWRYFEHDADIGVEGVAATAEEAMANAAAATFAIMCPPERIAPRATLAVEFREDDLELALVTWINLLLAHARERGLALGRFALRRDGDLWRGEASGEPWREGLERGTEVKGATLTALAVGPDAGGWFARCVVDV